MLQLLLDGQAKIRDDIQALDEKFTAKIDGIEGRLTKRIDKIEKKLATV